MPCGAAEFVVVSQVQQGVPEAIERHEPRSYEEKLFERRTVVDALLKWVLLCLSGTAEKEGCWGSGSKNWAPTLK